MNEFLFLSVTLCSLLVYVFHERSVLYVVYFIIEVVSVFCFLMSVFLKRKLYIGFLKRDLVFLALLIGMSLSSFVNLVVRSNWFFWFRTCGNIINLLIFYYYFPCFLETRKVFAVTMLVALVACVGAFLDSIGVLNISGVRWYLYGFPYLRPSKFIFFDLNYYAVLACIGFCSSFFVFKSESKFTIVKFLSLMSIFFSVWGLIVSESRTALVIILAWFLWGIYNKPKYLLLVFLFPFVFLLVGDWLFAFVRGCSEQGLTGREVLWPLSIDFVLQDPYLFFMGSGSLYMSYLLSSTGKWISSHNTYLDFAMMYGVPVAVVFLFFVIRHFVYIMKIMKSKLVLPRCDEAWSLSLLAIALFLFSNTIVITPGGISYASLWFAFVLGRVAFLYKKCVKENRYD